MQDDPRYDDVVDRGHGLRPRAGPPAREAGVAEVWIDPGIGFGKTIEHNLSLLPHLGELVDVGRRRRLRRRGRRHQPQALPRASSAAGARTAEPRPRPSRTGCPARSPPPLPRWWPVPDGPGPRRGGHGAVGPAVWSCRMKGKWAAGIPPRNFTWVIKDHLAVSERPGGFSVNHRRVRRQEEIIWLRVQGFGRVISLLPVAAQPRRLRGGGPGLGPLPPRAHRRPPARAARLLPGHRRLAGGGPAHPHAPGRAGRPHHGRRRRLPRVVRAHRQPAPGRRPGRAASCGHAMGAPGRELLAEMEGMPARGTPT